MQFIGTCSICGGQVTAPTTWAGTTPPVPTCQSCGATKKPSGPVIEMEEKRDSRQLLTEFRLDRDSLTKF